MQENRVLTGTILPFYGNKVESFAEEKLKNSATRKIDFSGAAICCILASVGGEQNGSKMQRMVLVLEIRS